MNTAGNTCVALISVLLLAGSAIAHNTQRVSVSSLAAQGDDGSLSASISADGRFVAFTSNASNLVDGDTNGVQDIFVHDRETGETTRVSVDSFGAQSDNDSQHPSISGDGRLVAFRSWATNLVPDDTNTVSDIFVHDRETGETIRVSVSSSGEQGDDHSMDASISADGGCVAFASAADNLHVTGGDVGVFVHDLATGETTKVSLTNLGGSALGVLPSISADGRFVAFASSAENMDFGDPDDDLDIYVRDRVAGTTTWASPGPFEPGDSDSTRPSISADGRYVAYESEADSLIVGGNNTSDIYVFDLLTSQLTQVSVSSDGQTGDDDSHSAAISADGGQVAFYSEAANLDPEDTDTGRDVFVHNRGSGQTSIVSLHASGQNPSSDSFHPSMSADGRFVAFESDASLVADDTNGERDIYVRDRIVPVGESTLIGSETIGDLLLTIEPNTGQSGAIGFLSEHFEGLAYDPVNDILYGVNSVGGANDGVFVVDRQTAEATPLGDPGALGMEFPGSLAFDPVRGILYLTDDLTDELNSVDTTTGVATPLVTMTGLLGASVHGLAFDSRSDTLFGLVIDAVVKIDPATGATVEIASDTELGAGGLTFDNERNILFATSWQQDAFMHRVDPGTGAVTLVGTVGGPAARVQGLAYVAGQPANTCSADLDGDGAVGINDFLSLLAAWGTDPGGPPDLDGDGTVGINDFLTLLASWGPCPVLNDMCRDSIDVIEGVFEFSTIGAVTDGPDNPECEAGGSSQIDGDIWFCYTASASGSATAGVCGSGFDTKLAVYNGCVCPPNGAPIGCNDDSCGAQSAVTFAVIAGERYMVRIGGVDAAAGVGTLTITCQSFSVPNDACDFATPIITPFFVEGTTIGALPDIGLPACGPQMTGPSVWYKVTGTGGVFNADTCLFGDTMYDSMLTVYQGDCDNLVCVANNDDSCGLQAGLVWQTEADTEYFIVVHGFIGANGTFTMFVVDLGSSR